MESLTFEKPSRKLTAAECDATFRARICVHCGKPIVIGPKSLYQQGYGGRALEAEFTVSYSPGDSVRKFLENTGFTLRTQVDGRLMIHVCNGEDKQPFTTKTPVPGPRMVRAEDWAPQPRARPVQATWTHHVSEESVEAEQKAFALAQLGGKR